MHLQEIADRIDTSVSTISSLERGTRNLTLDWIERLSEALDCHPSEIIGWPAPGLQQWEADLVEIFQHLGADIRTMKMIDAAETGMYRLANEGSPEPTPHQNFDSRSKIKLNTTLDCRSGDGNHAETHLQNPRQRRRTVYRHL